MPPLDLSQEQLRRAMQILGGGQIGINPTTQQPAFSSVNPASLASQAAPAPSPTIVPKIAPTASILPKTISSTSLAQTSQGGAITGQPVQPTATQSAQLGGLGGFLGQLQALSPEQKQLLGLAEAPEQKQQREALQGSLTRLIDLQTQLSKIGAPLESLQNLDRIIGEQSKALERLTPGEFLKTQPGLLDVGISQTGLERVVAAQREPIARALSDLLFSRSVLAQTQQNQIEALRGQIGGIETEVGLRQALGTLSTPTGLPSDIRKIAVEQAFKEPEFDLKTVGNDLVRVNPKTGKTEVIFSAQPGDDPLTTQQKIQNTLSLRKEFDDQSKGFITIRDSYERMKALAKAPPGPGDLGLIFSFMKVLDPTSVVREGEFANAEKAAGFLQRVYNIPGKLISGGRLTNEARLQFIKTGKSIFDAQLQQQRRLENEFRNTATSFGLDPTKIAPNLASAVSGITTSNRDAILQAIKGAIE